VLTFLELPFYFPDLDVQQLQRDLTFREAGLRWECNSLLSERVPNDVKENVKQVIEGKIPKKQGDAVATTWGLGLIGRGLHITRGSWVGVFFIILTPPPPPPSTLAHSLALHCKAGCLTRLASCRPWVLGGHPEPRLLLTCLQARAA
jgi:hypothetical protein